MMKNEFLLNKKRNYYKKFVSSSNNLIEKNKNETFSNDNNNNIDLNECNLNLNNIYELNQDSYINDLSSKINNLKNRKEYENINMLNISNSYKNNDDDNNNDQYAKIHIEKSINENDKNNQNDKNNLLKEEFDAQNNKNRLNSTKNNEYRNFNANLINSCSNSKNNSSSSSMTDIFDVEISNIENKKYESNLIIELPCLDAMESNEGYYIPKINEIINGYKVLDLIGKGVFSSVLSVLKLNDSDKETVYAMKIIRNLGNMKINGIHEKDILYRLNKNDPKNIYPIIRIIDSFEYKNYLCLVFEKLDYNIRNLLNENNKNGIEFLKIKSYTKQLILGLSFIHTNEIVHLDCKLNF